MTPKEKAEELINKFEEENLLANGGMMHDSNGKECALISVDEIIKELSIDIRFRVDVERVNYWIEVKLEISKL